METATPDRPDLWTLVDELVFRVPTPVLMGLEYATAMLVVATLIGCMRRIWEGDAFALGPLRLERGGSARGLRAALNAISRDDKLKANVLWMFRDRLNEASHILRIGDVDGRARTWRSGILTDVATALSRGGDDRHRASLWVRDGDELRMLNGIGFRAEAVEHARLPLKSIAGNVLRTGTSYNSADIDADRAFCPKPRSGRPYASLLAVPVKAGSGHTVAALCVDAEARDYFDDDDEFFAAAFADLIALLAGHILMETTV